MKQGPDGPFVRSKLVAMEVAHGIRFGHIRRKAASMKNKSGRHTRVLALYDIEMFMN